MKKTNKVVLVIVLVLVVAFGVGQFFAFSNPSSISPNGSSTATNAPTVPSTQIVYYMPPAIASSTPVEKGSCWTNSIAAPYRADAWRCMVGNGISDPCFEEQGSTSTVFCGANPADPNATSAFVLALTQPLPQPEALPSSTPSGMAWLVELEDGTLCSPFTGTEPFTADGQSASYGCAPQAPGQEGLMIFGNINTSSSVWTAMVGTLSTATSTFPPVIVSSSTVPVMEVWE